MTRLAQADPEPKRAVPDYDGRGNVDAEPRRGWSWIPRIVLFPAYVVEEYVVRKPIGWVVSTAERDRWLETAIDQLSWGPQHNYLILPTISYEWGFRPNAGLYFTGDNVFVLDNAVRAQVSTAGPRYLSATIVDRFSWSATTTVSTRFDVNRRSDLMFFGLGPDVTNATRSRWGIQQIDMHTSLKQKRFGESSITVSAGARSVAYRQPDCCGNDPSIDAAVAAGYFPMPPGYLTPYTVMYERADMQLDSRSPRPASGTGVYLRLHERGEFEVDGQRGWIAYGGAFGAAWDVTGHQRVLRLLASVGFVDPVAGVTPFNELASLGSDMMPGFVPGWMRGRSTAATQVAYTWPVSSWIDGVVRASAGNAFNERLEGFGLERLRLSGDFGVTTNDARDQGIELVFGLGTTPIDQGAGITSVRIAFGTRGGF